MIGNEYSNGVSTRAQNQLHSCALIGCSTNVKLNKFSFPKVISTRILQRTCGETESLWPRIVMADKLPGNVILMFSHVPSALGAGNYQQSQLPSANMVEADIDTERHSLFTQIVSTHSGVWGLLYNRIACIHLIYMSRLLRLDDGGKRRADGYL